MGFQVVFCLFFFQKILKVTPVVYPRLISNHNCIIARGNPWKKGIFIFFVKIAPWIPMGSFLNVSQFGSAVWPAREHITEQRV